MPDTVFPYDDDVRDPYDADDTKNPHEPSGEEPEDDGDDEDGEAAEGEPVKRRPGRPRKNPAP